MTISVILTYIGYVIGVMIALVLFTVLLYIIGRMVGAGFWQAKHEVDKQNEKEKPTHEAK